jgi:hypothetical protein
MGASPPVLRILASLPVTGRLAPCRYRISKHVLRTLIFGELVHRWFHAIICLAGIVGCSALFAGVLVSLELHARESNAIVRRHEAKSQRELDLLQADVRGAMHHLGYNAVVLPADQSLGDWYADDYAVKTMPASYACRLDDTHHLIDR